MRPGGLSWMLILPIPRCALTAIVVITSLLIYTALVGFPDPGNIDECDADRLGEAFGPLRTIYTVDEGALRACATEPTMRPSTRPGRHSPRSPPPRNVLPIVGFAGFDNTSGADVARSPSHSIVRSRGS